MERIIRIKRRIKASPEEVYLALTNPFTIELWSGEPAVMNEEAGASFSLLDGYIVGENIACEPNKSIHQKWFFGQDHASEVMILLIPEKANTIVSVEHRNVPEEAYENMLEGWKLSYLESLKNFFEK